MQADPSTNEDPAKDLSEVTTVFDIHAQILRNGKKGIYHFVTNSLNVCFVAFIRLYMNC